MRALYLLNSAVVVLALALFLPGCSEEAGTSDGRSTAAPGDTRETAWETVVTGRPYGEGFHGVHGVTFAPDGHLLAGSVVGQAIYRVDVDAAGGDVELFVPPPFGMADDLEYSPDGSKLAWTAFLLGKVFVREGEGGEIMTVAENLPGTNSTAWSTDGRLFFTQVFAGDAMWEADPSGAEPPRLVAEDLGGWNGFDFGPDGLIYGPIWNKGQVARIDPDGDPAISTVEVVADGFEIPAAVNFDSAGNLWVVDTAAGHVVRVDVATGEKTVVAEVASSIDNLAIGPQDRLVISNMADNGLYEIDTQNGSVRTIVEETLSVPSGIAAWGGTLHVADTFAYRTVDLASGTVTDARRMWGNSLEEIDYPIGAFADGNSVLLTSWTSGTVQVIDRRTGETEVMLHGFLGPVGSVRLSSGTLVVAEAGSGRLLTLDLEEPDARHVVRDDLVGPAGIAVADGGSVWVTETGAGPDAGTLTRIDIASGEEEVALSDLSGPEGLALTDDGRVLLLESGGRRLVAFDPVTSQRVILADDLPVGLAGPPGTPPAFIASGVAVSDGQVYFSSDLENAIYRVPLPPEPAG